MNTLVTRPSTSWRSLIIAWLWLFLLVVVACKPLSRTEVEDLRKSPEMICKAAFQTYPGRDFATFRQLALNSGQIKDMLALSSVPNSAKQASIKNRQAFWRNVEDSLTTVLAGAGIDWSKAKFEQYQPSRAPITLAEGYKMHLGRLVVSQDGHRWAQPFSLVEIGQSIYYIGDFGPFEEMD